MVPSSAVLTPKNARGRPVTKLCLALETFRRTDEGRARDANAFLGHFFPTDKNGAKDRLFIHIPKEVRADLLSNWGIRGKKSALRDDDERVRTTVQDALAAGDIDAPTIEEGVTPEILVDWAPLDDWWAFWRGTTIPIGSVRKALATARELSLFDERWFLEHLSLKSQRLDGTDVLCAALSKEQIVAWLGAVHASGDASPTGLVTALGWETILNKTAHEALLFALDALARQIGLAEAGPEDNVRPSVSAALGSVEAPASARPAPLGSTPPSAAPIAMPAIEPAKIEPAKVDAPKVDAPKVEPTKVDAPKVEPAKVDAPKVDAPKVEPTKVDAPKVEPAKADAPKVDAPKVDAPKVDAPKVDAPKVEPAKADAPKVDAPKVDAPKVEPAKADAPKVEPKTEPKPAVTTQAKPAVPEKKRESTPAMVATPAPAKQEPAKPPPPPPIAKPAPVVESPKPASAPPLPPPPPQQQVVKPAPVVVVESQLPPVAIAVPAKAPPARTFVAADDLPSVIIEPDPPAAFVAAAPAASAPPASAPPSARVLFGSPAAAAPAPVPSSPVNVAEPPPMRPPAPTLSGVGVPPPATGSAPGSALFGASAEVAIPSFTVPAAVDPAWAPPRAEPGDMGWDLVYGVKRSMATNVKPAYNFDDDDEPTSEIALPPPDRQQ